MTNTTDYQPATPESVWAAFRETDRQMKEFNAEYDRRLKETDRQIKETGEQIKETGERMRETDRQMKEFNADYHRRMKSMEHILGAWSNHQGSFAEAHFFDSFEAGKRNFFGERFDEILRNVKGINKGFFDEYDILLINGKSVAIVEVKYKAHQNDIPQVIRKAETFRVNFPEYTRHRVYLGLATLAFYPELEQECINQGIAVVKQVGNTVVINEANLKVF